MQRSGYIISKWSHQGLLGKINGCNFFEWVTMAINRFPYENLPPPHSSSWSHLTAFLQVSDPLIVTLLHPWMDKRRLHTLTLTLSPSVSLPSPFISTHISIQPCVSAPVTHKVLCSLFFIWLIFLYFYVRYICIKFRIFLDCNLSDFVRHNQGTSRKKHRMWQIKTLTLIPN